MSFENRFARALTTSYRARRLAIAATDKWLRALGKVRPPHFLSLADLDDVSYRAPSVVVEGVVSPAFRHEQGGIHRFSLACWKRQGGRLVEESLLVARASKPGEDWERAFPAFSLQRLRLLVAESYPRSILVDVLPTSVWDEDLLAAASLLRQPVVLETRTVGSLVLNREFDQFEGGDTWNGGAVSITIDADQIVLDDLPDSAEHFLAILDELWRHQASWQQRLETFVAESFRAEPMMGWIEDEDVTAEELAASMELSSLSLGFSDFDAGSIWFLYADGRDVLGGHAISVSATLEDGPFDIDLVG